MKRLKQHYHRHYKAHYQERAHFVFMLDAFLVATALCLLGLGLYFRWAYHPLRDDFRLTVAPVGAVIGAQETEIAVTVVNAGKDPLRDGRLLVHLPASFLPEDGLDGAREIEIAHLPAGASAEERFRGLPLGAPRTVKVFAHFSASGPDGRFDEKLAAADLRWERSLIEARLEAPASVIPGQTARFRLHVKNGAGFDVEQAAVKLSWPEGFRLIAATPPVYRGTAVLGRLEAGEEADVDFTGRFGESAGRLLAELTGTVAGHGFSLAEAQADVGLIDAGLQVTAAFPDEAPVFGRPGMEMPVVIRYRNDGGQVLKGLTLGIKEDPRVMAGVRWEASASAGDLAPGEAGERTVFIRILDPISQYVVNPALRIVPTARFSIGEPPVEGIEISGSGVERKVSGAVRLRVAARFFTAEGDQIGRGPLPPKVGKTTRYWIFGTLATGASEIQGGAMTFSLPNGVAWTGRAAVTAGTDPVLEGERLVWRLGAIGPHAGTLFEAPGISFEVALTPASGQVGTSPLLLTQAAFTGTDAWTGEALTATQPGLTTQLPGDPGIAGRTLVQP